MKKFYDHTAMPIVPLTPASVITEGENTLNAITKAINDYYAPEIAIHGRPLSQEEVAKYFNFALRFGARQNDEMIKIARHTLTEAYNNFDYSKFAPSDDEELDGEGGCLLHYFALLAGEYPDEHGELVPTPSMTNRDFYLATLAANKMFDKRGA